MNEQCLAVAKVCVSVYYQRVRVFIMSTESNLLVIEILYLNDILLNQREMNIYWRWLRYLSSSEGYFIIRYEQVS